MSQLELLQPETQTAIICHLSSIEALYSLIRASPRIYQVFVSRKEYHLTHLAKQQCLGCPSAWVAIEASKLPKPVSQKDITTFTHDVAEKNIFDVPIMPLKQSISMMKLGSCVEWFIADFTHQTLPNLTRLSEWTGSTQDVNAIQLDPSSIERQRIAQAFFRLEIFRHLFEPTGMWNIDKLQPGVQFLEGYLLHEVEEIACVKDYLVRRLWLIFDQIEDDLVEGGLSASVRMAAQAAQEDPSSENWFGPTGKASHTAYMENIIYRGLPFLKEIFTANRSRQAELVLSIDTPVDGYISDVLQAFRKHEPVGFHPYNALRFSSFHDDASKASIGWLWIVDRSPGYTPGRVPGKGLRGWGYVFWDKERIEASGVLSE